jgi:hypothetical protein
MIGGKAASLSISKSREKAISESADLCAMSQNFGMRREFQLLNCVLQFRSKKIGEKPSKYDAHLLISSSQDSEATGQAP